MEGVKLITVSWDDDNGLEVDWEGMSPYEAWAFLYHATELVEGQLGEEDDDD